jgi:hypothetical protein
MSFEQELNAENGTCGPGQHGICIHQLTGSAPVPEDILKPKPDLDLLLKFDMHYYSSDELFRSETYHRFQRKKFSEASFAFLFIFILIAFFIERA